MSKRFFVKENEDKSFAIIDRKSKYYHYRDERAVRIHMRQVAADIICEILNGEWDEFRKLVKLQND